MMEVAANPDYTCHPSANTTPNHLEPMDATNDSSCCSVDSNGYGGGLMPIYHSPQPYSFYPATHYWAVSLLSTIIPLIYRVFLALSCTLSIPVNMFVYTRVREWCDVYSFLVNYLVSS